MGQSPVSEVIRRDVHFADAGQRLSSPILGSQQHSSFPTVMPYGELPLLGTANSAITTAVVILPRITAGPDGNLWYAEDAENNKISPTLH